MTVPPDPFGHLHDEGYAARYDELRAGHAGLVCATGRATVVLDGDWRFTPDLFDEGLRQRWFADDDLPPESWTLPRDYDADGAMQVQVPSCWTMLRPEWRHFEGAGWYARDIIWDGPSPRLVLRVGAANYAALVFLNGAFIGSHLGGSTPFCIELTAHVRAGRNRLLIQVDNRRRADRVPMHHFDWANDGGLYRSVSLLPLPACFIRRFTATLAASGGIDVTITLSDPVSSAASIVIDGLSQAVGVAIEDGHGSVNIPVDPQRWSPDNPFLYTVRVSCGADEVSDRIGFRDIRVAGTGILLNGKEIYLRGVCVHEDDVVLGKVTNELDIRRRFDHAKSLGCNFLRLAHYPHHERVAEIAVEVGLLLWEEIPVYWAIDFANAATYADAENQLLELVTRDANRASVVVWGVGNENADTDARYRFMAALAAAARKADPTRLISAACLINRRTFAIEDRLASHLDVVGLNEYFGWYEPDFTGLEALLRNTQTDRPVIISEVGADALAGHRGGVRELFTEDCQAEIYRRQLEIVSEVPWVRGFCAWLLYDFRSERRQTRFGKGFNRKGLVAEDKATLKLAYGVVARCYDEIRRKYG